MEKDPDPASPSLSATDEALLRRVAEGCQRSFVLLAKRHERELFRLFRLLGADAHEAEDCAQETFLRLFSYRSRCVSGNGGVSWLLYRIARNVRADCLRKKLRSPGPIVRGCDVDALAAAEDLARTDARLDLEAALQALPEKLRLVVVLNIFQGLRYREVAATLGIPLGTVKSRMHLALLRLREVLGVPSSR